MTKGEIALQLTLAMIDKGNYFLADAKSNVEIGKCVAEMYNAISCNIDIHGRTDG